MRISSIFRLLGCIAGLLLPPAGTRAQPTQRQTLTTEDGLPQNSVHAVLQARDGFLWVATENGVARFDGIAFVRYGTENQPAFLSNDTCCLAQTSDGMLWIGTSDGLVRWSGRRFDRVAVGPVTAVVAGPAGSLLVLTAQGLLRVRGLQATAVVLPGNLDATALGRGYDSATLVAAGSTLLEVDGSAMRLTAHLPAAPVEMFEVKDHRLWFRSASEVWTVAAGVQRHWRIGSDLPGSRLLSLSLAGNVVLAGTNRGVFQLAADKAQAQPLVDLENTAALTAATDREGDLWVGTDTAGLSVLRPRAVGTVAALANDAVTSVVQMRNRILWVGTRDSGLREMSTDANVPVAAVPPSLTHGLILSLAPGTSDDLWIGSPEGLDHLQNGRLRHTTSADGLPDDFIRSLLASGPDAIWVGTRHGVAHLQDGIVDRLLTATNGLPSDVVGTMLQTQDRAVWFGTLHGLAEFRGSGAQPIAFTGGKAGDGITALVELPDGTPLAGTHSGALAFRRRGQFVAVHVAGLTGEIDALLLDTAGNVWVRTPAGVQRTPLDALLRCSPEMSCVLPIRLYGTADGMPSVDSSSDGHPSAWRAADGVLWFATRRGLARIDAAHLPINNVPPPLVLERVQVDDLTFAPDAALELGPGHRRFVFDYAALSLRAPLQVVYRFKLEGFDRDWTVAGNRRSAEYTNLPPGKYRFLVEARNADGTPSAEPAVLRLHIASPLYRRWWSYVLLVLGAGAIVYAGYRLRLRGVQHEFQAVLNERNRIAREIHDTLAQDFVAVSLQLEVTAQLLKVQATEAAQQQVDATRMLVRDGIRDARDSIWALRAGQAAGDLPARLRRMVEAAPATPVHTLTVTGSYRPLASSLEKEILRIAKEATGNAVRHADATLLEITLIYLDDALVLTVRDDGGGFSVESGAARAGHYGLRGMQERAASMGAAFTITSVLGEGTTISLRLAT